MASSTLLDEQEPQSPMPETTRSAWLRRARTAASSISWLGERFFRTIMEGGRFILQEANNLPPRCPLSNLAAVYETCLEDGRYA